MQIQISWLLQKHTDLDLHCLQRQSTSGFSRTGVNLLLALKNKKGSIVNSVTPDEMGWGAMSHPTRAHIQFVCHLVL